MSRVFVVTRAGAFECLGDSPPAVHEQLAEQENGLFPADGWMAVKDGLVRCSEVVAILADTSPLLQPTMVLAELAGVS